ncbi:MAG: Mrp/NBP35 family ATP-binding protein [Acidilobaceae archaeon]|nr:Mrp/NBP35 family ATP-binding protein [Acidilobaceae archaeon]
MGEKEKGLRMDHYKKGSGGSYKEVAERMKETARQQSMATANMLKIKYKLLILSSKGGVGKSLVTSSLAISLALMGKKVGVLDADFHGPSAHKMLGVPTGRGMSGRLDGTVDPVEAAAGVKLASIGLLIPRDDVALIWRGPIKAGAIRELLAYVNWGPLDYLLIDLPPGTGDEPLTLVQSIPKVTGIVLVTIPSEVSKSVVKKAIAFAAKVKTPIVGIIENMSYLRCPHGDVIYVFGKGAAEELSKEYNIPFLGSIPLDPRVREASDRGKAFFLEYPDSEAAQAFREIAARIVDIVEGGKAIIPEIPEEEGG